MDPDHDHNICIQVENDDEMISVSIESNLEYCAYQTEWHGNIIQRFWSRMKAAAKILFTGRLAISSSFYFQDEDQVHDYIQAINDSLIQIQINAQSKRSLSTLPETARNRAAGRTSSSAEDVQGQGNDNSSQDLSS